MSNRPQLTEYAFCPDGRAIDDRFDQTSLVYMICQGIDRHNISTRLQESQVRFRTSMSLSLNEGLTNPLYNVESSPKYLVIGFALRSDLDGSANPEVIRNVPLTLGTERPESLIPWDHTGSRILLVVTRTTGDATEDIWRRKLFALINPDPFTGLCRPCSITARFVFFRAAFRNSITSGTDERASIWHDLAVRAAIEGK